MIKDFLRIDWRIGLYFFIIKILMGCQVTIPESDIIFLSGKYCDKMSLKPFSGNVVSVFSEGGIEGKKIFENGFIVKSIFFDHNGEQLGDNIYENIDIDYPFDENFDRVVFVTSNEGESYHYFTVKIVVEENLHIDEFESLKFYVMRKLDELGYMKKINNGDLTFQILLGELETPLFETDWPPLPPTNN